MQLEDYFDFLAPNDIRIKGHRIGIETVVYEYPMLKYLMDGNVDIAYPIQIRRLRPDLVT